MTYLDLLLQVKMFIMVQKGPTFSQHNVYKFSHYQFKFENDLFYAPATEHLHFLCSFDKI